MMTDKEKAAGLAMIALVAFAVLVLWLWDRIPGFSAPKPPIAAPNPTSFALPNSIGNLYPLDTYGLNPTAGGGGRGDYCGCGRMSWNGMV